MQATMKTAMIADEVNRLRSSPPLSTGLVSMSPTVAPSGRVRMKAIQNNSVRETPVKA